MKQLSFVIFVFLDLLLSAQQVQLRGVVQDDRTGKMVANAVLVVQGREVPVDSNGYFFTSLPVGSMQLRLRHAAYYPHTCNLVLKNDTSVVVFVNCRAVALEEVAVKAGRDNDFGISRMNNVDGTTIYAGKKSEAVYVQDLNANLAANNSRQVFSKVPGINIFENDGSGASIGIGGRGLNPNRISNFNMRQNGYDISADALGYPESYYTPPTEAIERIEILRGAAGLQFGTQFGGMINYKFAEAPLDRKMSGNFRQTAGSYGFYNSFNQLSGTVGKYSYNTFYQYKHYTGWRPRSEMNSHNIFGSVKYRISEKLTIGGEYTFLNYISQQPGGLSDRQFAADPSFVNRHRNWFRVKWNLLALSADYKMSDRTTINATAFGLDAGRDALGVLGRADRADDTSTYRNLLADQYNNHGAELRVLHRYTVFKQNNHILVGARYYRGQTIRKQGDAHKSSLPRFEFMNPVDPENSSYLFPSRNIALFAENIFQFSSKFSVTPGLRYENIYTSSEGYYRLINRDLAGGTLLDQKISDNRSNHRSFLLAGIGTQYKFSGAFEMYGNFSQNYRSINFNDMRIVNPNFQVDPELRDESGFTVDGGVRGALKNVLYFDAGVFYLKYNNRIGTALRVDETTYQVYRFRTNIGDSRNLGIETITELDWIKLVNRSSAYKLSTFVNYSYISAVYSSNNDLYNGKLVEFVPAHIFRTGLTYAYKHFGFTCQYSYTGRQFSDASNAVSSPSGIYGEIPAYNVIDVSAHYDWRRFAVMAGINNLGNSIYFTRRAEGYPGPGIMPADPRNFYLTLRVKI